MKTNNNKDNKTAVITSGDCDGGTEEDISSNKKECTSCEQNNYVGAPCKLLNDMIINDTSADSISLCANCGKGREEGSNLKVCTACKLVKYCNRECQIAHRPQHKKQCKKRAAELQDEKLFKQPPLLYGDCPICFLRMPSPLSGSTYMACCGKVICNGCIHAVKTKTEKHSLCAFCRTPDPTSSKEEKERYEKRAEADDPIAIYNIASSYFNEGGWYEQNQTRALELWHQAGDLGNSSAYCNIGYAYDYGEGVEVDKRKAKHYYQLAAVAGNEVARKNLGCIEEEEEGNTERALKHWMIAVRDGDKYSLDSIQELYTKGITTKDDYAKALRAYQSYLGEIKSNQRDEAAAYNGDPYY